MFVAPMIVGGREALAAVEAQGVETIADAARALATEVERIDDDVLITARLQGVVMFTGLVQGTGNPGRASTAGGCAIDAELDLAEGDSVAVNGVCLTATAVDGDGLLRRRDGGDPAAHGAGRARAGATP